MEDLCVADYEGDLSESIPHDLESLSDEVCEALNAPFKSTRSFSQISYEEFGAEMPALLPPEQTLDLIMLAQYEEEMANALSVPLPDYNFDEEFCSALVQEPTTYSGGSDIPDFANFTFDNSYPDPEPISNATYDTETNDDSLPPPPPPEDLYYDVTSMGSTDILNGTLYPPPPPVPVVEPSFRESYNENLIAQKKERKRGKKKRIFGRVEMEECTAEIQQEVGKTRETLMSAIECVLDRDNKLEDMDVRSEEIDSQFFVEETNQLQESKEIEELIYSLYLEDNTEIEQITFTLPDLDTICEKIFSLQREEGNWEISDLSVISLYLQKSTEQILKEIAESGAKSLGTSVYSKLLHFIPTLILLFFLHTVYPQSFEMSPSFISWTVIPPKWKPSGDKALSFLRLFNKHNPSLSSRLDLGTSWYQYAEKQM